ncbi:hypothetical protein [Paenibacillus roseipurpureus]|uniref:DUF4139 domain-containing protein n=1 Tax=Paenibacillus roseopurpureus TaxID=2918901 RepID=A0AA96LL03_9BACL|nr:hypothetical protein [Paenibacillus sp. MBLB1832]WNR43817.1 hypothetical protein MJB10_22375 [Paenibacillus sp. MBLB1832]
MKINWKKTTIMFILAASLVIPSATFQAAADAKYTQASTPTKYQLTDSLQVEVKSILNEPTANGTRLGAVVRLSNVGSRLVGVPEYEVRVKTDEGLEYIMRPSQANPRNIQPRETIELSYMNTIDRYDEFSLSEISWLDVDEFVYPKQVNRVTSVPIADQEWKGDKADVTDLEHIKKWDESFTIPALSDAIAYTPVSLGEQNSAEGLVTVVGIMATNVGTKKTALPDFRVNGKSDAKVFSGKRLEQESVLLGPGEKTYIHYALPVKNKADLKSLLILTPETFVSEDKTVSSFLIGRLSIGLGGVASTQRFMNSLPSYTWNRPIQFDPLSDFVQSDVEVSLVDLRMSESTGGGFKAVVAKFKMLNKSGGPVQVPHFDSLLTSSSGKKYAGIRQDTKVDTLIPNIGYVIYYSYIVPNSETGDGVAMEILDSSKVASFKFAVAAFKTKVVSDVGDSSLAFYPFDVKVNNWTIDSSYNSGKGSSYTYKLNIDLDVGMGDEAVVDQSYSKLRFEAVDGSNRVMTSKLLTFTGDNKVVSGMQTLNFDLDRYESSVSLRMYEIMDTPFGEVRRLVQTWKR